MSTAHNPIRLFETVIDDCPYLEGERSGSIIVDPEHKLDNHLFSVLSESGFRRSGEMLYTPKCPSCRACVSVRIPAERFTQSRGQRRIWNKNKDLTVKIEPIEFRQSQFNLYLRYQKARHSDSSMCDEDPKKYLHFIRAQYSKSRFVCFYLEDTLAAVCVIDQVRSGVSAVYTFFEPALSARSLGTYAILYLLKLCQLKEIPFVYLGYWVKGSPKMGYKSRFKPLEGFIDRNWVEIG